MNDSEPVPGPPLPGISSARYDQVHRWLAVLLGLAGLVAVGWYSVNVYADYLWHAQLGYGLVFLYFTVIRTSLFLIGGMLAATLLAMNFAVLLPLALGPLSRPLPVDFLRLCLLLLRLFIYSALIISGLAFGSLAHDRWPQLILLLHQAPFAIADPPLRPRRRLLRHQPPRPPRRPGLAPLPVPSPSSSSPPSSTAPSTYCGASTLSSPPAPSATWPPSAPSSCSPSPPTTSSASTNWSCPKAARTPL